MDYKKILEGVVDIINTTEKSDIGFANICAYIGENCPELKESENKRMIQYFKDLAPFDKADELYEKYGFSHKDAIAWLEKQGEQKPIDTKNLETAISNMLKVYSHIILHRSLTQDELNETDVYAAENTKNLLCFLEQKPADKVEPKFRIEAGKWYICISQYCNCIEGRCYQALHDGRIIDDFRTEYDMHSDAYKYFRLWTIQDAKDGDVLANNGNIILFKQISDSARPDYKFIQSYCFALMHSFDFYLSGTYNLDDGFHPAIKEQRDTLFARMKEVGYEWDAEKKDLKKIEQSPDDDIERKYNPCYNMSFEEAQEYISNRGFDIPWTDCDVFVDFRYVTQTIANILCWADDNPNQKPAWSEEDENHVKSILSTIECCKAQFPNAQAVVEAYNADIEWLKSIRPQWKPNEEMLEALYRAIPKNVMEISEDEMLLDKLYQGLKYGRVLSEK